MLDVVILKGLPGSGKSTWAKKLIADNPNKYKRVNKDDLRAMLDDSKHSNDSEKFILKVRDAIILAALEEGRHVIVDDTNFASKHEDRIRQLVKGKAEVHVRTFYDVSVEDCIARDIKRANSVGEKVIRGMYDQFLRTKEVYTEDSSLPKAILVDIDGTLAKMNGRSPYDWARVGEDTCNETIKEIVNNYKGSVIVFSGRDAVCQEITKTWLYDNAICWTHLFMRPEGNSEKDSIIKRRMFEENIRGKYYIEYVLDDRDQVVRMYRDMGLTVLQVAEGNF